MITLLPYNVRSNFKIARRNTTLVKYIAVLVCVGVFLAVYYVNIKIQINSIKTLNEVQINTEIQNDQARVQKENSIKSESSAIQAALSSANANLRHPSYFKLLTALASSLPSGVVIDKFEVSDSTMKSPVELKVLATSAEAISGVKQGFAKNQDIFTNVSVESITSGGGVSGPAGADGAIANNQSKYSTTATLKLTINTGALNL